jgi:ABC-type sulfate transport system permease subunit
MPMVSEITPLFIITKLEQYDYAGATAIAVVMLVVSFLLLLTINLLQAWARGKAEIMARTDCRRQREVRCQRAPHRTAIARAGTAWVRTADRRRAAVPDAVPVRAAGGGVREALRKGWDAYLAAIVEPDASRPSS